ncbi:glycosyltransferase [Aphanothece hegewaldii CCALA 016]|uniref:Glycosyltransferase n=2 Tax=Aphanothece TaxID=1121 RepID=A0A2T1M284_9CHRO|nr:glycosyltransferase [Aphanothece hegewaldii CCALA 016]
MIVKNEEANLQKCLKSVQNIVNEMIVMDTGSTDRTVEIAQSFGAQVPYFKWCDNFSTARNAALKYVTGDWILVLDADETLEPKIIPQIRQIMNDENALVINFIRHEIGAAQSPYSLVCRLFRNHPKLYFNRPYHTLIDDSAIKLIKEESHWKVIDIPAIGILHYGYQPEFIKALDKYERARKAMEGFWKQNPHDSYVCSKLGALYLQIGQTEKGLKLLKQGLKANTADFKVIYELHYSLGNAYVKQQKIEQAVKHYQKAIAQPILPQLKLGAYNNLGGLLQAVGDIQNAKKAYEFTINIDPNFATGYYNLGMLLKEMGNLPEAVKAYQKAISINPEYAAAYQNLAVVFFKLGYLAESQEAFKQAIILHEIQNPEQAEKLRQGLKELGMLE